MVWEQTRGLNPYINFTADNRQTSATTFAFPSFTAVVQTDNLEIGLSAEATTNLSGGSLATDFLIDDPIFAIANQMKLAEIVAEPTDNFP